MLALILDSEPVLAHFLELHLFLPCLMQNSFFLSKVNRKNIFKTLIYLYHILIFTIFLIINKCPIQPMLNVLYIQLETKY